MTLTLILGDQLHRDWFSPSPLNIGAGERVVMIEDLGVASSYRYHKLRLLHTFVAMRHFRDSLLQRGVELRDFELPESAAMPCWPRLADELGDGRDVRVA
ncbi:MAG: cryptochrome/photolyase family protein, partial [Cyanobacteriota bacterium]